MEKIEKLRGRSKYKGLDAILITSEYNRRYMTNFTGTAGVVLISRNKAYFITDFRYVEQASKQCKGFEIIKQKGTIPEEVARQHKNIGIKKLGFEQDHMTFSTYKAYESAVVEAELVPVSGLIEKLRLIKTACRD